jgi:hypothetical protein
MKKDNFEKVDEERIHAVALTLVLTELATSVNGQSFA